MSFVELIAYYAAPTLEGMKPSCLFSCRDSEVGNVEEFVLAYNRCLNPKRIYLQIMKHSPDFKLILVYHNLRPSWHDVDTAGGYTAVSVCFRIRLCDDQTGALSSAGTYVQGMLSS